MRKVTGCEGREVGRLIHVLLALAGRGKLQTYIRA